MNKLARSTSVLALLMTAGCATQQALSDADIQARYPELGTLRQALQQADQAEVDLLAADLYQQAQSLYGDAGKWARGGSDKAHRLAEQAATLLKLAQRSTRTAEDELAMVLRARERALKAGARNKDPRGFDELEQDLIEMGNLIAKGRIADVREARQDLARQYARLEVEALKSATAKDAEERIRQAENMGAGDHAPVTLKQAQEELKLAKQVLETDANARDKAAQHAQKAYWLAGRAMAITDIIKEFRQSGMTAEQQVLWYQTQLAQAVEPIVQPDFAQANKAVIVDVRQALNGMKTRLASLETELNRTRDQYAAELAEKEKALTSLRASSEAERERQAQIEARFRMIRSMFTPAEAEVYRQGNNVLIRSYGFSFPSGGSEITSDNFPLLNKIIRAIGQFPDARVKVSGHTDNRGSDALNQRLSAERAEKVARFLVDVGNLDSTRVSSEGFGKTRPVASNETAEGRAANRRVEILIIND